MVVVVDYGEKIKGDFFNLLMKKLKIGCFGAAKINLYWYMAQNSSIKF